MKAFIVLWGLAALGILAWYCISFLECIEGVFLNCSGNGMKDGGNLRGVFNVA